jgi:hypothetical protein
VLSDSVLRPALDSIETAVSELATSTDPLAKRIVKAWARAISLKMVPEYTQLPQHFRSCFEALDRKLCGASGYETTVAAMKDDDLRSRINEIIQLYAEAAQMLTTDSSM